MKLTLFNAFGHPACVQVTIVTENSVRKCDVINFDDLVFNNPPTIEIQMAREITSSIYFSGKILNNFYARDCRDSTNLE